MKQEQFDFSLSFLALIICNLVYDSSVAALSSGKQQRNKDRVSANEKGARYSSEGFLGHDVVEVVHGDDLVVVGVGALDHLLELLVGHGLTKLAGNSAEILEGDGVGAIIVEKLEDLIDILAGVLIGHTGGHHVKEFLEIDVS